MSDSNRVRVAYVEEVTLGTTPNNPAMKTARITGESLGFEIGFTESKEMREDRMTADTVAVSAKGAGSLNVELSFAEEGTFHSDMLGGVLFNAFQLTPVKAGNTECTAVTGTDTFGVNNGGAAFKAGLLIRTTGYTSQANNGLHRVTSATATTIVTGTALVNEASTAASRIKVVGFRGVAGDLATDVAPARLKSTALDFTTLPLRPGMFIAIGGTTAAERFSAAALNTFVRILSIGAAELVLDTVPTGWAANTGAGKTITVYVPDTLANGLVRRAFTFEKGFMDLGTEFFSKPGNVIGGFDLNVSAGDIMTGSYTVLGTDEVISAAPIGASYAAATTHRVMNSVDNIGRLTEGGITIPTINFCKSITLQANNNLREKTGLGKLGLIDIGVGKFQLSGSATFYFGSSAIYQKYLGSAESSFAFPVIKDGKAMVWQLPRIKFETGKVLAQGENQDVMAEMGFRALRDPLTAAMLLIDRFEEYAA